MLGPPPGAGWFSAGSSGGITKSLQFVRGFTFLVLFPLRCPECLSGVWPHGSFSGENAVIAEGRQGSLLRTAGNQRLPGLGLPAGTSMAWMGKSSRTAQESCQQQPFGPLKSRHFVLGSSVPCGDVCQGLGRQVRPTPRHIPAKQGVAAPFHPR